MRLLAGNDRAPERNPLGSCPVRLQLPLYSDARERDNTVRQDSHSGGDYRVWLGRFADSWGWWPVDCYYWRLATVRFDCSGGA
jgi:hypothetical protein